jgi:hypothetical protein
VIAHVHAHETALVLVSRFLPGLRTAIPIACAYAGMRALKFSTLNLISAFAWAGAIMAFVKGRVVDAERLRPRCVVGAVHPGRDDCPVFPVAEPALKKRVVTRD